MNIHYLLQIYFIISLFFFTRSAVKFRRKEVVNGVKMIREMRFNNRTLSKKFGKMENFLGLDILMVADYAMYQNFLEMSRGDEHTAHQYSIEYLNAIFEQMKTIYDDILFNTSTIQLKLAGTFVAIRPIDCPLLQPDDMSSEDINRNITLEELLEENNNTVSDLKFSGQLALLKLGKWVKKYEDLLAHHDHVMLITKMDLTSSLGYTSSQGMAQLAATCVKGDSSSVVEDVGAMATAIIAAHELGHNLGSPHDGTNGSISCNQSMSYLMAPSVSGNLDDERFLNIRRMSKCSIGHIEDYISTPKASCIHKKSRTVKKISNEELELLNTVQPGERFSASKQCQIAFGKDYGLCTNPAYMNRYTDPCRRIWCKNRKERRSEPCATMSFFPAFDGTICGMNKWCMNGSCVANPKKMLECKDVNDDICRKYSKAKLRHYCNAKDFQNICCLTCFKVMYKETQLEKKV